MGSVGANKSVSEKKKSFSEMNITEKKEALKDFEKSMDERFKHYDYGKYKIYNVGGQYAAYQFKELKDDFVKKSTNTSWFAVDYEKTLKALKAKLGG